MYMYEVKSRHTYVYHEESISESSLKAKSIHKSQCLYFGMFLVVRTLFTTLTIELPQWIVQFILEAALSSQDFCFQTLTSVLRYQHLFRVTQGVSPSSKSGTRACMAEQAILPPDPTQKVMVRPTQMGRLQAQFLHEMGLSVWVNSMNIFWQIFHGFVFAARHN